MRLQDERIASGLLQMVYSTAVTCALPLVALGLCASRRGRRRLPERFGCWENVGAVEWWLHGASVGEVQGLLPLIAAIGARSPESRVLLSATSPTGLERGARHVAATRLVPVDAPSLVGHALGKVVFDRFVVSETELWPNLLRSALHSGKPCHIVNGRISDYTLRWYRGLRTIFQPLLQGLCSVSVSDQEARLRFIEVGAKPESVHVTGHTKYDTSPKYNHAKDRSEARAEFFQHGVEDSPIVVLGSIREGEERVWWEALQAAWRKGERLRVIVAPRHAEKFEFFWERIGRLGRPAARWSETHSSVMPYDVLLLDSMGMLERAYAASDLAFVGATLVDIGGHNPFEPAMYGVPVVVGPYTSVIREPVASLKARRGIVGVSDSSEVQELLHRVAQGDKELQSIGRAGRDVWAGYSGAAQRVLSVISQSEADRV